MWILIKIKQIQPANCKISLSSNTHDEKGGTIEENVFDRIPEEGEDVHIGSEVQAPHLDEGVVPDAHHQEQGV